jgi:Tfp pilus assembly protein PilN
MTTSTSFASPFSSAPAPDDASSVVPAAPSLKVDWAPVPRVNLLPPEIIEARRFRRTQQGLAVAVVLTLAVAGATTLLAQLDVTRADSDLQVAQARTTTLRTQAAKYSEVTRVLAKVETAKAAREQVLGRDVLWFRFMNDLAVATPDNVDLSSMTVTILDASTPGGSVSIDPLTPGGLGDVTFSGNATRFPDVATWLTSVAEVHGLDASRLQSASRQEGAVAAKNDAPGDVSFSTKVVITQDALSHRYDRKAD